MKYFAIYLNGKEVHLILAETKWEALSRVSYKYTPEERANLIVKKR
jgi:hypothetical protein